MALLGGMEKHPSPAYRLRGDINILLLGDPGVAKSQVGRRGGGAEPIPITVPRGGGSRFAGESVGLGRHHHHQSLETFTPTPLAAAI